MIGIKFLYVFKKYLKSRIFYQHNNPNFAARLQFEHKKIILNRFILNEALYKFIQ